MYVANVLINKEENLQNENFYYDEKNKIEEGEPFKGTHRENTPSDKTEAPTKILNMYIWAKYIYSSFSWALQFYLRVCFPYEYL